MCPDIRTTLSSITMDINSTRVQERIDWTMQVPCVCDHHMLSNQDEPCIFGHSYVTKPYLYLVLSRMTCCDHGCGMQALFKRHSYTNTFIDVKL